MKKQDYLRNNPFFWSRLGFCYDPPITDENGNPIIFSRNYDKYIKFHKDFENSGIKYHTTILHSGWVGDKKYDYSLTDETLEALLKDNPNIMYMPRVKLNVPVDWCRNHPEDVFVYEKYKNLSAEEIASLVGTADHDWFGFNCANGYAVNGGDGGFKDTRPNLGNKIGLQSFSSPKWIEDASAALANLIKHIVKGPYAKQIIGYHVAYGQCGETCLWGGWRDQNELSRGDFGKTNTKMFVKFGLDKYGSEKELLKKWGFDSLDSIEGPSLKQRDLPKSSLRELFYDDAHNLICRDYNEFSSRANAKACESFCRVVKDKTDGEAAAGIFYGYIYMPQSAYMSHCDIDYVLNSPYIDFLASPKAYFRTLAGDPGGEQGPSYSINKKKIWLDEIDNWTHLDRREGRAENFFQTRTLILREGIKNLSSDQGFWWMDLGEGWYDMPEIMDLIKGLSAAQKKILIKKHKSAAEILIVVDENSIKSMSASYGLTGGLMYNLQSEVKLCGAPVDTLRLSDLYSADLSRYKMIVFANAFSVDGKLRKILKDNAPGKTYVWNYAAGILNPHFGTDGTKELTGFEIREFEMDYEAEQFGYSIANQNFGPVHKIEKDFPLFEILTDEKDCILSRYPNGYTMCAEKEHNGGKSVLCAFPSLTAADIRSLAQKAGCTMYAPLNCTVYADNRILGFFPKYDAVFDFELPNQTVNGKKILSLDIKAKGAEYFVYD